MTNDKSAATWHGNQSPRPISIHDRVWHVTDGSGTVKSVYPEHVMVDFDEGHRALVGRNAVTQLRPDAAAAPFTLPTPAPARGHSGKAVWLAIAVGFAIVVALVVIVGVRAAGATTAPFYGACPNTTVNCSTMQPANDLFGGK